MRIYLAQINPTVADIQGNKEKILCAIERGRGADLLLFPELAITGYPPDDFLLLPHLLDAVEMALEDIGRATAGCHLLIGTPRRNPTGVGKPLYNSGALFADGQLVGYQDKRLLPTYDVFDERRYFEPGSASLPLWTIAGEQVAITLCEDIWRHQEGSLQLDRYGDGLDPVEQLAQAKPPIDLLINLSASPFSLDHPDRRRAAAQQTARRLSTPLILCNQVGANDSLIFDGASFYLSREGTLLQRAASFVEDELWIDTSLPMTAIVDQLTPSADIAALSSALVLGIQDYFGKQGFDKACLGLSGGIDSAVVACLAVEALGPDKVLGLMMPSRYSSPGSLQDACELSQRLSMEVRELPIDPLFQGYLALLEPQFGQRPPDATEENLQARIRGNLLMAFSNKFGHIVLSTGNKSELAVGYSTLYGDSCGGLAVINDLTKRRVYQLAHWINRQRELIPLSILEKAPSAELRPNQRDSDTLPPYELLDAVVEQYLEEHLDPKEIAERGAFPLALVEWIVLQIHRNEYKRRQSPPGLRVTAKAFSAGRRFPIVQRWV